KEIGLGLIGLVQQHSYAKPTGTAFALRYQFALDRTIQPSTANCNAKRVRIDAAACSRRRRREDDMAEATLTISSKTYSSWSLRGWLLVRMAGLAVEERVLPATDPSTRAELLLLSPSFLVPCLTHDGVAVWDTLAIAEYLHEWKPKAGLLPKD